MNFSRILFKGVTSVEECLPDLISAKCTEITVLTERVCTVMCNNRQSPCEAAILCSTTELRRCQTSRPVDQRPNYSIRNPVFSQR